MNNLKKKVNSKSCVSIFTILISLGPLLYNLIGTSARKFELIQLFQVFVVPFHAWRARDDYAAEDRDFMLMRAIREFYTNVITKNESVNRSAGEKSREKNAITSRLQCNTILALYL